MASAYLRRILVRVKASFITWMVIYGLSYLCYLHLLWNSIMHSRTRKCAWASFTISPKSRKVKKLLKLLSKKLHMIIFVWACPKRWVLNWPNSIVKYWSSCNFQWGLFKKNLLDRRICTSMKKLSASAIKYITASCISLKTKLLHFLCGMHIFRFFPCYTDILKKSYTQLKIAIFLQEGKSQS